MSRIGKQPVLLREGVKATLDGRELVIEKGGRKLSQWIDPAISVAIEGETVVFARASDDVRTRALHGLYRALAQNMVTGLLKGYQKTLKIVGVGYGARPAGKTLELNVGYANPVRVEIPEGLTVEVPDASTIVVKGHDKHRVGQLAADIRRARPPEPYKGKGIRYSDEVVRRKAGKTVGASGS
ncbi:MAG: 50S ribosomal protein L6 [Planctomycetes bacterium]|nr:50S ribosomal protein L6 [Planctomycetota bacterium]